MTVDCGGAFAHNLRIGQTAQGFGIELRHGWGNRSGGIGAAENEGAAQDGLVIFGKGSQRSEHRFIPNQRAVTIAVACDDGVTLHKIRTKEQRTHLHDIFGIFGTCGHAHEGLVGMFHRRICDAQMPVADWVIIRLYNVVSRRVDCGQHMR